MNLRLLSLLFLLGSATTGWSREHLLLETTAGEETRVISGNKALMEKTWAPASTFKMVIAWCGFESSALTPETTVWCEDPYVPGTPRRLALRDALYFSSNDYFVEIGNKIGIERLRTFANQSGFFENRLSNEWPGNKPKAIIYAGDQQVTPQKMHAFTLRLMRGQLGSTPEIQAKLEAALEWPSSEPGTRLFGKTGAMDGAVWFTGFGEKGGQRRATTVLVPYPVPQWAPARATALELFYKRWGQKPPAPVR